MPYILKKGSYYCSYNKNGGIRKTQNIAQAKQFTKEEAAEVLEKATKKLAGYELVDVSTSQKENAVMKVKRKNLSQEDRAAVYNRYEGRCGICGKFVPYEEFTIDHIMPLSKGGSNDLENLQCACKDCNAIKQNSLSEDFHEKLEEIILYQMKVHYNEALWKKLNVIRRRRKRAKMRKKIQKIRQKMAERLHSNQQK